jgi:hypothetical protein
MNGRLRLDELEPQELDAMDWIKFRKLEPEDKLDYIGYMVFGTEGRCRTHSKIIYRVLLPSVIILMAAVGILVGAE